MIVHENLSVKAFVSLLLIQVEQRTVTGERLSTENWLMAYKAKPAQDNWLSRKDPNLKFTMDVK